MTVQQLLPGDFGPPPREDPLAYPGERPGTSFVYNAGEFWQLTEGSAFWEGILDANGPANLSERIPVLCSGSNANPAQIDLKFRQLENNDHIVFLQATLSGAQAVYAGHVAHYGAIPATLEESDTTGNSVLGLFTPRQLRHLVSSEHGHYNLVLLSQVKVEAESLGVVHDVFAFLSKKGVLFVEDKTVSLASTSQREVLADLVRRTGIADPLELYLNNITSLREPLEERIGVLDLRRQHRISHEPTLFGEATP